MSPAKPIPVILDTDIGGDIDDTWALALSLRCPELDVRLVVSDTGDTMYRAKIAAKLLEVAARTDISVGVGLPHPSDGPRERQKAWVADYDLARYPGTVRDDGVDAIIQTAMDSPEPVTLICIGPVPNIAAALDCEPGLADRCRFVGMLGSIRRSHEGQEGAIAEFNVLRNVTACRKVLAAPWQDAAIAPLDTCGLAQLTGDRYARLRDADDPLVRAVVDNYRIWAEASGYGEPDIASTTLFDTVAVHLAYSSEFLVMERMGLRVTEDGLTLPDPAAPPVDVALDWTDLDGFEEHLATRLLGV